MAPKLPVPRVDAAVAQLLGAPKALGELLVEIRAMGRDVGIMASHLRVMPNLDEHLGVIAERVEILDKEVSTMRHAVERLEGEVIGLRGEMEPVGALAGRMPRRRRPVVKADGEPDA